MRLFLVAMAFLALFANLSAQSCCSTGPGTNYSILPALDKHIIGLRYTHKNFFATASSLNPGLDGKVTNQYLNSLEVFGRFNLAPQLQLSFFMPVSFIREKSGDVVEQTAGLSDMSFLLQYQVLKPAACNNKSTKHQLRLGLGTKLPSGEFTMDQAGMFNTTLQPGTGSVDFLASGIYTFRYKNAGLNTSASYKLNTGNSQHYRFGDRIQVATSLFYVLEVKGVQLLPSVAISYEHQFHNSNSGRSLDFTGGDFLNTSVGFDVYYKQFAFSGCITPAIMNRLNWNGENKNRFNAEAGVFYNFSTQPNK